MSFTAVFGGDTIDPSYLSYAAYTMAANLELQWPLEADDDASVMAAKLDITATASSLSLSFPDARAVSVGRDALVKNVGATTFAVLSADGTTLGTVASGTAWYFYLIDNATEGGTWQAVQFGAGTSTANAASLSGAGLQAILTLLNQNLVINPQPGDYAPGIGDRATVILATGGVVDYTPTSAATLGNGWFVWVVNGGDGVLTWTPPGGQTVDGEASKVLAPTESAIFFSDGANFWTAAYGRSITTTVSSVNIDVTALVSPATLSANQVVAQVQDYTGTLSADLVINYGAGAGYWFVFNNTSGAHSLTLRVNGADPGVAISQGSFSIIRSNGASMSVAFTDLGGTVTSVATTADLTGGPITTSGTLGLSNTGVTPGAYGDQASVASFIVDAKGRLTAAATVAIAIAFSQVGTFPSSELIAHLTDETGTGVAVFNNTPSLVNPDVTTQVTGNSTTKAASTAFVNAQIASALASSPILGGNPTAATQAVNDNSTRIATTAYADRRFNFAATTTLSTALPNGVWTKVLFDVETFDNGGYFDPATSRYTPLVAGQYALVANVKFVGSSEDMSTTTVFYKNGVIVTPSEVFVARVALSIASVGNLIYLFDMNGSTDYIEVFAKQDNNIGAGSNIDAAYTSFAGWRT